MIRGVTVGRLKTLLNSLEDDTKVVFVDAETGLMTAVESASLLERPGKGVSIVLSNSFDLQEKFENTGLNVLN